MNINVRHHRLGGRGSIDPMVRKRRGKRWRRPSVGPSSTVVLLGTGGGTTIQCAPHGSIGYKPAGCETPTISAGHAPGGAQADHELTFNPEYPIKLLAPDKPKMYRSCPHVRYKASLKHIRRVRQLPPQV